MGFREHIKQAIVRSSFVYCGPHQWYLKMFFRVFASSFATKQNKLLQAMEEAPNKRLMHKAPTKFMGKEGEMIQQA